MTDTQLLKALSDMMDSKLEPIIADIATLKSDVSDTKDNISALQTDVAMLKEDVAMLKEDVAMLKHEMAEVKADVATLKQAVAALQADLTETKHTVARNYNILLEFYGKQQEFNTRIENQLHSLTARTAMIETQTLKNTMDIQHILCPV